ncbi:hypothetical protein [Streptomyces sp. NPDC048385]|uniref:hypothetical protein n=1 Tax=unclassified Streptomyces TaxID=2593676 RepID=UPI0034373CE2
MERRRQAVHPRPAGLAHPDTVPVDAGHAEHTSRRPAAHARDDAARHAHPHALNRHHPAHHIPRPPLQSAPPATPTPSPSDSTPPLAETGSNAPGGLTAGTAALVNALGAGAVYATHRARRS